jgi:hypothetical protein
MTYLDEYQCGIASRQTLCTKHLLRWQPIAPDSGAASNSGGALSWRLQPWYYWA